MSTTKWSLPEFTERYEYVKIDPEVKFKPAVAGNAQELKQGVRFQINDRTGVYDHANAYFNVDFHIETLNGDDADATQYPATINGAHSLIRRLVVENSNGDTLYECSEVNKAVFVKKLLTQSADYGTTVGEDEFWAIDDTRARTSSGHDFRIDELAGKSVVNAKIPLRNYSIFESLDYNNVLLSGMQLSLIIDIENDNEIIYRPITPPEVPVPHKLVIDKFELWTPLCILRPQHQDAYNNSIMAGNLLTWNYLREVVRYSRFTTQADSWRISGIVNPKKLIYFFIKDAAVTGQEKNTQHFDSFFPGAPSNIGGNATLTSARVEVGSDNTFYPRTDYKGSEPSRIYGDVIKYAHIDGATKETGLELSRRLFKNMYSMLYFDLDFRKNQLVTDTTDIVLHFTLSAVPDEAVRVYCVVLFENEAEFGQIDGNFMVKSTNTKS